MQEWEIGAVENIHGALPYIQVAPILALVGVGVIPPAAIIDLCGPNLSFRWT